MCEKDGLYGELFALLSTILSAMPSGSRRLKVSPSGDENLSSDIVAVKASSVIR